MKRSKRDGSFAGAALLAVLCGTGGAFAAAADSGLTLGDAAAMNDTGAMAALIAEGADVDAGDPDGLSPLHWAVIRDSHEAAELLLAKDASGDVKDVAGWTPLHYALAMHDAPRDLAVMLIERGADVGAATTFAGWTPLHLAAYLDDPVVVAALLARGAPVNARARIGGWTPLHLARWTTPRHPARRRDGADNVSAILRAAGAQDRVHDDAALPTVYAYGKLSSRLEPSDFYPVLPSEFGTGGRLVARGSFTAAGARERLVSESLGSISHFSGEPAQALGLIDGSGTAHLLWITDDKHPFRGLCRDPSTGLHHAIFMRLYGGSGNPGDVVYMYYDPERKTLVEGLVKVAHAEVYEDEASSSSSASPTECRWRVRKAGIDAFVEVLDVLRVGELAEWGAAGGEPIALPTRIIPAPVAESSLGRLRETPAVPASVSNGLVVRALDSDAEEWTVESPRWDVFVVSGARAGDYRYREGVVLVRDKERGEWRSIYDCRRIDVRNVRGNTLFADFFDNCDVDSDDWTGFSRHHFKVDLLTWRAQRVEEWAPCEAPSTFEEREQCEE